MKNEKKVIKFDEYVKTKIFLNNMFVNKNVDNTSIIEIIEMKIYVIENFVVNLLLNNDVIYFQIMKRNSKTHRFIIEKCENFRISLNVRNRFTFHVKRIIRFRQIFVLMFDDLTKMSMTYHESLSKNFFFSNRNVNMI